MNKITLGFFRTKSKTTIKRLLLLFVLLFLNTQASWGQTYYAMSGGNYSQVFTGFSTAYPANFNGLAILSTGSIPVATKTTTATNGTLAVVGSGTAIGYDAIVANSTKMIFLCSGATDNSAAVACDLNLDFTGRNAGSLSFNYANILNSSVVSPNGRASTMLLYYSTDGIAWASLGGPYTVYNNTGASTANVPISISLPAALNNQSTVKLRFYEYNGGTIVGTPSGSRPKISLDDISVTSTSSGIASPTLTADTSSNTVDNPIDITFTDDSVWRGLAVVKIGTTTLSSGTDYDLTAGNLQLKPSGLNALLTASGSKSVTIVASGYTDATVTQVINAGMPTTNSTATISAALAPNTTSTITCTAKDQYNNPVSGYVFKYDATITNNDLTNGESYTIDAAVETATANDISLVAVTNGSGIANFNAALPAIIDGNDGISIQVQLSNGTTNTGSAFTFTQLASQTITFGTLTPVTYGDAAFGLTATASSTLPVSYVSSNAAVATVTGNTITIVGAGSTDITASQAGNGSYNAATNVIQSLTVSAIALTLPDAIASNRTYNGLLTTDITGILTGIINFDAVTLVGTLKGTFADANVANGIAVTANCTLAGAKAGNYLLTQPIGLMANITQASQTITFGALANKPIGTADYSPGATSATSGINAITYASSNTAVATIVLGQIHIVGLGSTTITASQAGSLNYAASADVVQSLTVVPTPIAAWDFTGISSTATATATTFNTNLVSVSSANTITRGAGAALSSGSNSFRTVGFQNNGISTANTDYFQITIQASAGKTVSLSTIDANFIGTTSFAASPGVSSQFAYSLDGTTFNLIGSPSITIGAPASLPQIDLTSVTALQNVASGTTITLRYYASGQTTTGGWGFNSASAGSNGLAIGGVTTIVSAVWDGSAWSNITGPTASLDAVIAGNYSTTTNGNFTAKKLTINAGTLTINSGTNVTVQNEVINTAGTTGIIIESNANLIQDPATTINANTGAITVKRNSNPLYRLDYTIWSSPVASQNLLAFSPLTTSTRFYSYDNTAGTSGLYSAIADPASNSFAKGAGYLIRMPNEDPSNLGPLSTYATGSTSLIYNGVFTGEPNNGDVPVTLNYGVDAAHSYNLVGNPYPSTIDANAFITANTTNIESTLYFWRKTNGSGTAYAAYNPAGGVLTYPSTTSGTPNGTIQTGQGFFVQAKSAGLIANFFTNAMRLGTSSTQFFKTKQVVQKDRIWLNLTNPSGVFSQTLVGYITDASLGLDIYDGRYINDSPIALTSNINNEEYTIQGRPAFDASDVVALNFKTDVAGDYTIAIDHIDGLFATGQDVYLVDSTTGAETNLKTDAYTFTAAAGVANVRFSLKYQKTLKVDAPAFNDNSVTVYKNKGTLNVNSAAVAIANIKVFDIQGRLIAEQKNVKANSATISNLKATQQVLIVKVTGQDNSVVSKKVVN